MTTQKKQTHYNKTYKLIAQTFGLIVCLVSLFYLIGVVIPEIVKEKENNIQLIGKLILLTVSMAGFVLTWYREKVGAVVLIAGSLLLIVYGIIHSDYSVMLGFGVPFGIIGGLFLFHLKKRNDLKGKKQ